MVLRALNDIWIALRSFDDQALFFAGWAVLIYTIFIVLYNLVRKIQNKKHIKLWQMVISICLFGVLCIYLSYLVSLTLSGREAGSRTGKVNLEIFGTWSPGGSISLFAAENVLLFIPFGLLVPLQGRFFKRWWNHLLLAFISSLSIEVVQLITGRGYFEIDDILLNVTGAFIGYMVFWVVYHSYIAFRKESQLPLNRYEQQVSRVVLFIIQLLPIILIVMFIFGMSGDNGEESGALSLFVTEKLLYIVNKVFSIGWTAEKISKLAVVYEGTVRKLAHMAEFGTMTLLTFVFFYCRKIKTNYVFVLSLTFSFIVACMDEYSQLAVAGRNGCVRDVFVDLAGTLIVLFVILLILAVIRYYNKGRQIKNALRIFRD